MFETCSKRCMLLGTVCLGVLTIVVLILESHLAETLTGNQRRNKTFPTENNSTCWIHQPYKLIRECHPCSDFEIRSKSIGVCIHTSFKEILRCDNGETVTRSVEISLISALPHKPTPPSENLISPRCCLEFVAEKTQLVDGCDRVAYLEERTFWKFTIWSFVVGAVSSIAVMLRMRVLNHRAKRRARQVLSNGSI